MLAAYALSHVACRRAALAGLFVACGSDDSSTGTLGALDTAELDALCDRLDAELAKLETPEVLCTLSGLVEVSVGWLASRNTLSTLFGVVAVWLHALGRGDGRRAAFLIDQVVRSPEREAAIGLILGPRFGHRRKLERWARR